MYVMLLLMTGLFRWQVKGTFTRTYNKASCPLPYATASMSKKKRKRQNPAEDVDVMGVDDDDGQVAAVESEQSDEDDIAADSMIKVDNHAVGIRCIYLPLLLVWVLVSED